MSKLNPIRACWIRYNGVMMPAMLNRLQVESGGVWVNGVRGEFVGYVDSNCKQPDQVRQRVTV